MSARSAKPSASITEGVDPIALRGMWQALRFLSPVVIAITYIVMMVVSWRRWADVMIDFGRELYVPWRITEGDVLYRDLAVFFGQLSAYVNALWFMLFGTSLMTLAVANAIILAAFTTFLHWILKSIAGGFSAAVGCVVFLMVFAFGHLQGLANYNFISPYSHELTHGAMLGLSCVAMLARFVRTKQLVDAAVAGLLLGLTFLTKLEPFVATIAAVAGGWLSWMILDRNTRAARWRGFVIMGAVALVPPIASCALLATAMPFDQALRGTFGSWRYVGDAELHNLPFYRVVMGTNKIALNLGLMLKWTGIALIVPAAAMIVSWFVRPRGNSTLIAGVVAALVALAGLWWTRDSFTWEQIARPLPLVTIAALVWSLIVAHRATGEAVRFSAAMLRVMFVAFALAILLKMILNARFAHYGFVLAMPATLVAIAALMDWMPSWLDAHNRSGWILRGASFGAIAIWLIAMQHYNMWNAVPVKPVGDGGDWFYTDQPRAEVIGKVLENLQKMTPLGSTMTVLPEGVMLNYLTRMPAGTPYFNFLPPELAMFGEPAMLAALQAAPPDYIAIVHRDSLEYGRRFFGRDFGVRIGKWIAQNYTRLGLAGDEPSMDGSRFGILVMQRNTEDGP